MKIPAKRAAEYPKMMIATEGGTRFLIRMHAPKMHIVRSNTGNYMIPSDMSLNNWRSFLSALFQTYPEVRQRSGDVCECVTGGSNEDADTVEAAVYNVPLPVGNISIALPNQIVIIFETDPTVYVRPAIADGATPKSVVMIPAHLNLVEWLKEISGAITLPALLTVWNVWPEQKVLMRRPFPLNVLPRMYEGIMLAAGMLLAIENNSKIVQVNFDSTVSVQPARLVGIDADSSSVHVVHCRHGTILRRIIISVGELLLSLWIPARKTLGEFLVETLRTQLGNNRKLYVQVVGKEMGAAAAQMDEPKVDKESIENEKENIAGAADVDAENEPRKMEIVIVDQIIAKPIRV